MTEEDQLHDLRVDLYLIRFLIIGIPQKIFLFMILLL